MENENKEAAAITDQVADEERKFTQSEVTEMIKKRLERANRKASENDNSKELEELEAKLKERENALNEREKSFNKKFSEFSKAKCVEYLKERDLSDDLLTMLDTSDFDAFKKKVDDLSGIFRQKKQPGYNSSEKDTTGSKFSDYTHVPKKY